MEAAQGFGLPETLRAPAGTRRRACCEQGAGLDRRAGGLNRDIKRRTRFLVPAFTG